MYKSPFLIYTGTTALTLIIAIIISLACTLIIIMPGTYQHWSVYSSLGRGLVITTKGCGISCCALDNYFLDVEVHIAQHSMRLAGGTTIMMKANVFVV